MIKRHAYKNYIWTTGKKVQIVLIPKFLCHIFTTLLEPSAGCGEEVPTIQLPAVEERIPTRQCLGWFRISEYPPINPWFSSPAATLCFFFWRGGKSGFSFLFPLLLLLGWPGVVGWIMVLHRHPSPNLQNLWICTLYNKRSFGVINKLRILRWGEYPDYLSGPMQS